MHAFHHLYDDCGPGPLTVILLPMWDTYPAEFETKVFNTLLSLAHCWETDSQVASTPTPNARGPGFTSRLGEILWWNS